MLRLGLTETTLLFYYYLENILNLDLNKLQLIVSQNNLINWLYSTSGFYDKTINGTYFDIDVKKAKESHIYNYYFSNLLNIVKNYDKNVQLNFHNIPEDFFKHKEEFNKYLNCENKGEPLTHNILFVYKFIENKRVLIINNLGILMKQQYENGNTQKINKEFPDVINIDYINPGYTWLNNKNGKDKNFIITLNKICKNIENVINNFDVAIISCGAYSAFIMNYIYNIGKKECVVCGGELCNYFGISIERNNPSRIVKEYHIFVPDELKPVDYKKIENGTYW
jgi:hypothetical protein